MPVSEIAQIRQRIEEEYTAAQRALHGPAMVGKHEFITKRMENMQHAHVDLQGIIGEAAAIKMVVEIIDSLPEITNSGEQLL